MRSSAPNMRMLLKSLEPWTGRVTLGFRMGFTLFLHSHVYKSLFVCFLFLISSFHTPAWRQSLPKYEVMQPYYCSKCLDCAKFLVF